MHKPSIITLFVACTIAIAVASPLPEDPDVRGGMRDALKRGLERFGGAADKNDRVVPLPDAKSSKVYSLYTRNMDALGGGKPLLREQYREHNFVPLAPTVVPEEHKSLSGKLTPEEAAARYVPKPPFQFSTDNLN